MTATIGKDGYCTRCQLVADWCECPPLPDEADQERGRPARPGRGQAGHVPNQAPQMAPLPADAAAGDDPVAARLEGLRAALLDSAALDAIPAPRPVIDGMLYRDGLAWLYGKPATYKSFIALDWAGCVAAGLPWHGHETTPGTVLYVIAEGATGLRKRVRAWEDYTGHPMAVTFLPIAVQLLKPVDRAAFTRLVADLGPALVVLDTQARVTIGAEENSTREMGELVAAADAIRAACRACVLTVHHEPRNGENMRGAIALEGAAASLFRAERDGARITLRNTRQRDIAEADDIALVAVQRLDSIVVVSNEGRWTLPVASASEALIVKTLSDTFPDTGASATLLMEMTKLPKSTFYNAVKTLVSTGQVMNSGTRNRSFYELPKGRVQLGPTESNGAGSPVSNVQPPFKGLDTLDATGPDATGPADSSETERGTSDGEEPQP